jgi:hypothetical protein
MAALQIIDPQAAGHNYADPTILGHAGRSVTATVTDPESPFYNDTIMDSDEYYDEVYNKASVFKTATTTATTTS